MGGLGSGRWSWHRKARTVEECRVLDLAEFARGGFLVAGYTGRLRWLRGETEIASIGYFVRPVVDGLVLILSYAWTPWGDTNAQAVGEPALLETPPVHFAG